MKINNLSQLKKHLIVGTEIISKFPNQAPQKRTVTKKQTNGVYMLTERGTNSFCDLDCAKDWKFLTGNIAQLFLGDDLAVTYYL